MGEQSGERVEKESRPYLTSPNRILTARSAENTRGMAVTLSAIWGTL